MSDGSVDEDLFGDSDQDASRGLTGVPRIQVDNEDEADLAFTEDTPAYVKDSPAFAEFVEENDVQVNNRHGYVCVFLYRQFYFPG